MRAVRGKVGAVVALLVAVGLALSALAGLGSQPPRIPPEGPWVVALEYPEGAWQGCLEDPSLTDGRMTADLPVTRATARTVPDATAADVRRVVDCLARGMTGGSVHVSTADPEQVSGT